jgi:acyl-CoA-dependent ceramide synthase
MGHSCFPRLRKYTRKCFRLLYYNPDTGEYAQGWNDACMVMYWFVLFTGLRASVIDFMLVPFAHRVGIESKFGEQAWEFIYNSTF